MQPVQRVPGTPVDSPLTGLFPPYRSVSAVPVWRPALCLCKSYAPLPLIDFGSREPCTLRGAERNNPNESYYGKRSARGRASTDF